MKPLFSCEFFEVLTESKRLSPKGNLMMKGILQRADTLNQNGRIYPREILEREVRNYQKLIKENRSTGELDHPDSSVVELKNVSHIIREARMDGTVVYGEVEILPTPAGQILAKLVENDVKLGISSRGVGSTKQVGDHQVVQEDFQLICWDFVSEPSTPGAFMMAENRERVLAPSELNKVFTRSDRINRAVNELLLKAGRK
jgi:hypothetical protein